MVFASENLHLMSVYSLPSTLRAILTNRFYPKVWFDRQSVFGECQLANLVYELIVRCVFSHRTISIGEYRVPRRKRANILGEKCSVLLLTILVMMIMLYTIVLRCFIIDISTCVCRGYFCPNDLCLLQIAAHRYDISQAL